MGENMSGDGRIAVFISSYLEPEYVEQIRAVDPVRLDVIYEPDLFPPRRYVADHHAPPGFHLSLDQQQRYLEHVRGAEVMWDFPELVPKGTSVLELAPRLRWVQTTSAGVGQAVARMGLVESDLIITTSSGVHAAPLAEFVFMALLMCVKEYARLERDQRERRWERFCSDELDGKTLAIVGPGKIGRQVAKVGRAFGMRVLGLARTGGAGRAAEIGLDELYTREGLHEMLSQADAVVICCPHTPETEGLIDRAAFEAIKPGAMFVNIARGQVVDEAALLDSLRSGEIAFAGLDVFQTEPLPPESPFWDLPNVIINPHSASTALSENRKITEIFCHNLRCYLDGRIGEMLNVLDKQRMY